MIKRPRIVLVQPRQPGNVGFVARAMMNMDLEDLAIVQPMYNDNEDLRKYASGASRIVDNIRHFETLTAAIANCRWVIGTTRRQGKRRGSQLNPKSLAAELQHETRRWPVAIVFGSEKDGLSADDLQHCHDVLCIATSSRHESLNLSHAVVIVAYEIFNALKHSPATLVEDEKRTLPTSGELEGLYEHLETVLSRVGFVREETSPHQMRALRQLFGRAPIRSDEVTLLRGICRQILWGLENKQV